MKSKITRAKELETILAICVMLVIFHFIMEQQHNYFLVASIVLGLIGMLSKTLTSKIVWAWAKLSEVIGSVTSKIILTLVFFGFLWPIAMLSKILGNKIGLHLRKKETPSYFIIRNHKFKAKDLENGW